MHITVEPRLSEPSYNAVLGITNDMFRPNNSKIHGKEPGFSETSLWRTVFVGPLALCYIGVGKLFQQWVFMTALVHENLSGVVWAGMTTGRRQCVTPHCVTHIASLRPGVF